MAFRIACNIVVLYFSSLAGLPCWRQEVGPVRANVPLSGEKDPTDDDENDNDDDDESNDDENADDGNNIYNYNVQHQKNQMIGLANGSSGGGGNASGGEESEPEVPDGTR